MSTQYSFRDTDVASKRLRLLAQVFAPEMRAFLRRVVPGRTHHAVDLGCGPGSSTRILIEALYPEQVTGLDASKPFIELAKSSGLSAKFVLHDITKPPLPVEPADIMFTHFVLTHLPDPAHALRVWARHLAPKGLLLLDEVEHIQMTNEVFRRYLAITEALVKHNHGRLYIGSALDAMDSIPGLRRRSSEIASLPVSTADAASMFRLNLEVWRNDPFVQKTFGKKNVAVLAKELDGLRKSGRKDEIEWGLRQIVYERV
ncbi:MAG: class I SAM-dependent methyltransferase [Chloroflexi bacterium]|nr:class I SAM-dependent methyltransferase [Chloroflexota bacterium]